MVIAIVTANNLGIGIAEIAMRQSFGRTAITTETETATVVRSLSTATNQ